MMNWHLVHMRGLIEGKVPCGLRNGAVGEGTLHLLYTWNGADSPCGSPRRTQGRTNPTRHKRVCLETARSDRRFGVSLKD